MNTAKPSSDPNMRHSNRPPLKENRYGTFEKSMAYYLAKSNRITSRPQKQPSFVMSYSQARSIVWRIMVNRMQQQNRLPEVDIHNKAIIVNLIKYFIGDKTLRSDWSLHKGLLCIGDVGSGKTFLMSVMQDFCKVVRHPHHQFKMKACTNIYDAINNNNPIKSLQPYYKNNWCFDDLGDEPTTLKYYGNDIDFMTKIITRRYEIFVNGHCVTHATTNLIPKDIQEKYGARFFDPDASGCRALFNIVVFKGESRRR